MASPFNIKRTTHVGREGFDMSQRHLFNAFPGALIPVMCEETLPGDTHRINLSSFTRMRNLNTAAFARFKEYYDFYWVSMDTLWPYFNSMVVNNNEPVRLPNSLTSVPYNVPYCGYADLLYYMMQNHAGHEDDMGIDRYQGFRLLCDMLGYGFPHHDPRDANYYYAINLLPFAFYQQIYANYYRNPQWERRDVSSYNLNAYYGSDNHLYASDFSSMYRMFILRYANWHKDYFMGLYPSQQFGDVSVVSTNYLGVGSLSGNLNSAAFVGSSSSVQREVGSLIVNSAGAGYSAAHGDISIVDLRRAQALQRWKEVTMTNGSSMYQQVKAHYGFELPEGRKDCPEFIGGLDNVITIEDINATSAGSNSSDETFLGQVGGKGLGVSDPNKTIEFTSKDFGLLMCIYHVEPLLDYNAVGLKKFNSKLEASDFYLPEFDKIGFGSLQSYELYMGEYEEHPEDSQMPFTMGYTSRYLDYKTSYDRVHGSFIVGRGQNFNDGAWTIAITEDYIRNLLSQSASIDYRFFKVSPFIANNIMIEPMDEENIFGASPFMVSADFKYYKTSNMSADSLPY